MLNQFLTGNAYALVMVFCRIGAALSIFPGLSASYVPQRVRLLIAVGMTLSVFPVIAPLFPPMPTNILTLTSYVALEIFYGIFLGLIAQVAMSALHMAGTSIGNESGLSNAMVFDPVTEQQGALVIGFLSNVAIVLIFVMDLHHVALRAIYDSYLLFRPGQAIVAEDHLEMMVTMLARSSYLALQLASPFVVFALIFQTAMGVLARLSPQMNVFFVAMPLQILFALGVLWVSLPAIMMWFLSFFEESFTLFLAR